MNWSYFKPPSFGTFPRIFKAKSDTIMFPMPKDPVHPSFRPKFHPDGVQQHVEVPVKNSTESVVTQNRPLCADTNMVDPCTVFSANLSAKALQQLLGCPCSSLACCLLSWHGSDCRSS
jgi:hypothetical protein